jgi:quercetin dioxygenase-like cupin family protein
MPETMRPEGSEPYRQRDLFGGHGEVLVWSLAGPEQLPSFSAVLACELEAGGSVGAHVQQEADEIVVITQGSGTARVDGEPQALTPGAVVWLPLGKQLALQNDSDENPLLYLIIKAAPRGA